MSDLMKEISAVPRMGALRKINEMVKRIRQVRVHCILLNHLRSELPFFGKEKKKKEILENVSVVFLKVMKEYDLSAGDFPDLNTFRSSGEKMDWTKVPKLKSDKMKKRMIGLERSLEIIIPTLLSRLPGIVCNTAS